MADERLYFEDLVSGREWVSAARVVTADDVAGFAQLTGDRNPVHLDPAFARSTPFRRCVAHGLLGLALTGGVAWTTTPVRVVAFLGLREWHFRAPIYFGDAIRAKSRVLGPNSRGGAGVGSSLGASRC